MLPTSNAVFYRELLGWLVLAWQLGLLLAIVWVLMTLAGPRVTNWIARLVVGR